MKYVYESPEIEGKIQSWLDIASHGEISMVLTCLGSGISSRLNRLAHDRDWLSKLSDDKYNRVIYYDLRGDADVSNIDVGIEEQLACHEDNNTLIVINGLEEVISQKQSNIVKKLLLWHHAKQCGILLVANKNLLSEIWSSQLFENISFAPMISYFGLWSQELTVKAVLELAKDWEKQITNDVARRIAVLSGGYIAIAKRLAWHYVSGNTAEIENEIWSADTIWLVDRLWKSFERGEQYCMLDILGLSNFDEKRYMAESQYLRELGLIVSNPHNIELLVLEEYVKKYVIDDRWQRVNENELVIDGREISKNLTGKQIAILKYLMAKQELVTRDELMEAVWGDETISDWALDGQISRLRKALEIVGIDERRLVTKKGKGYIWQEK